MSVLMIQKLERLLVTANALLTAPHPEVEVLETYNAEREKVFAQLWNEERQNVGERAIVESFVTEILLRSTLIGAKVCKLYLSRIEEAFVSVPEKPHQVQVR